MIHSINPMFYRNDVGILYTCLFALTKAQWLKCDKLSYVVLVVRPCMSICDSNR